MLNHIKNYFRYKKWDRILAKKRGPVTAHQKKILQNYGIVYTAHLTETEAEKIIIRLRSYSP